MDDDDVLWLWWARTEIEASFVHVPTDNPECRIYMWRSIYVRWYRENGKNVFDATFNNGLCAQGASYQNALDNLWDAVSKSLTRIENDAREGVCSFQIWR